MGPAASVPPANGQVVNHTVGCDHADVEGLNCTGAKLVPKVQVLPPSVEYSTELTSVPSAVAVIVA